MNSGNDIPRRLGDRYEIGEVLGRGGMAEVHLSRDTRLGRLVAVKMLRADLARDPVFQARFRREAHSAAALNHPAVVAVYDTGEDSFAAQSGATARVPYIVMEYVEGRTGKELLQEVAARGGDGAATGHAGHGHDDGYGDHGRPTTGLGVQGAVEITAGVLTALDYSHRQGIIHRDIKPANVMITPTGQVKVMDFGIARALADTSATMTQTSAVIGTAQYLSPEQARGETVDARTDLYSTGCLLFELLTGRPPFVGDSPVSIAYQHVREVPPPPSTFAPDLPDAIDRVVLKALAKDRDDRYDDAEQFRVDLLAAADGRRVGAPPVGAAAAMATRALPSSAEATRALSAAGLGGAAAGGVAVGAVAATAATRRQAAAERTAVDPFDDGYDEGVDGASYDQPPPRTLTRPPAPEVPRSRTGAVVGIVLAVLVALGLLGVVVNNLMGDGGATTVTAPAQVEVPPLAGLTIEAARTELTDADLRIAEQQAPSDTVAAGSVIEQAPVAATPVDAGSTVTVTVSTGSDAVTVPEVAGDTESQARGALEEVGLRAGDTVDEPSAGVPEGRVTRTDPEAGTELARDAAVTLFVSSGQAELGDYTGDTLQEAREDLVAQGFTVLQEFEESTEPQNTVLRQDPAPGPVDPDTSVTLFVASPPAPTSAPTTGPTEAPSGTPTDAPADPAPPESTPAPSDAAAPTSLSASPVPEEPVPTSERRDDD